MGPKGSAEPDRGGLADPPGQPDRGGLADPPGQPDRGGLADPPGRIASRFRRRPSPSR